MKEEMYYKVIAREVECLSLAHDWPVKRKGAIILDIGMGDGGGLCFIIRWNAMGF
jgi:hypothetical protein